MQSDLHPSLALAESNQPRLTRAVSLVIPCYQPSQELAGLVDELLIEPLIDVLIVDDGSDPIHRTFFDFLARKERVIVLHHAINLGKGQALKTAFNHFLLHRTKASIGVITADADGQHKPNDILRLAQSFNQDPTCVWLGVRTFSNDVPLRSSFGNQATKWVMRFVTGIKLTDTQTGLRALPPDLMRLMLRVPAQKYEFELEMLIKARQCGFALRELGIETVYTNGNKSSHFRPLVDSLRIYFVFLRFMANSLSTACLDYLVFSLSYFTSSNILLSTAVGRLIAGTFNFSISRRFVFHSRADIGIEATRYAAVVILLMLASYGIVTGLVLALNMPVMMAKVMSEGVLYFASFAIQRLFVFGQSDRLQ